MFIQALVINLTPILFIPLRDEFSLSWEQIGRLVLVNFLTQMVVDLVCCWFADRVPTKPLIVAANLLAGIGLWLFALAPGMFDTPYYGLMLGTVVFSVGCGLLEVLLSPIINAIPSDRKSSDMAMLHAFYPIGKVAVILLTGIALYAFGIASWRTVVLAWSVFPILNTLGFLMVGIPAFVADGSRTTLRALFRKPIFFLLLAGMLLAGATEVTIAQWTSAFVEGGLGYPKVVADLVGFTLFGVGMIIGRVWFGLRGEQGGLLRIMIVGALLSTATFLVMALSPSPIMALAACVTSGFFVSMLWPGTLSLSTHRFPLAGASMFAFLAAAGDTGAALMPWTVGLIADQASGSMDWLRWIFGPEVARDQLGLRAGLLIAALCPFLMIGVLCLLLRRKA
jgi:fucose permease